LPASTQKGEGAAKAESHSEFTAGDRSLFHPENKRFFTVALSSLID
jgi:hypothetical protein